MDKLRTQWLDGQEAPAYSEIGPYSFQVRPSTALSSRMRHG